VYAAKSEAIAQKTFAAPPILTGSQWADKYRMLVPPAPEPGHWRTTRTPYLREILDAACDPAIERIVVMKSAGVGYTEGVLGNVIGYHIDQDPAAMLVMLPGGDEAEGWSKENLTPLLVGTPQLHGKVIESERRNSQNTLRLKQFPGGFLAILGSNSAAGLRRRRARILMADEVDGYGTSAKGKHKEGDPLSLAMKRLEGYWNRKVIEGSTPTVKGASRIEADYEISDQRRYFVPCPHCGHRQTLKWSQMRFERDKAGIVSDVQYQCGDIDAEGELLAGCGELIGEQHKADMVEKGEWVALHPGRPIRGYRIWAAYSLLGSWRRIAEEWFAAQGDVLQLQVFVNTVLGETWEERGEHIEHGALLARCEEYPLEVPAGVAVLTMGVDVQGDRLELSVFGEGLDSESWLIKHEVLWGDPGRPDVWGKLDLVRERQWMVEGGRPSLIISCTAVDSGGHHTSEVTDYCTARWMKAVFSIKGSSEPGHMAVTPPSKPTRDGKRKPFMLGTEAIKDVLFARIRVTARGPGYMHFPKDVGLEYFEGLTSEVGRTRYINKRPVRKYERLSGRRAEPLDCAVYAYAALLISGLRDRIPQIIEKRKAAIAAGSAPSAPAALGVDAAQRIIQQRVKTARGSWVNDY
jgi:phage terminase large subunit GpA-like protein